jgi:dolichyl-phosphate-mannose--protein O-mannosyl transferase
MSRKSALFISFVGVALVEFALVGCAFGRTIAKGDKYVTCGSLVKLQHQPTRYRLHSHQITYGTGSRQQSVMSFPDGTDTNSYWRVWGPECGTAKRLTNGDLVTLQHVNTKNFLHSHRHQSPLSNQQEVSCYEGGNGGDMWVLNLEGSNFKHWIRGTPVRFLHQDTHKYLSSSRAFRFNDAAVSGQLEVACAANRSPDSLWTAQEGVYIPWEQPDTVE